MFKCTPPGIAYLGCVHILEVDMHAAYVCIYNMSFYCYVYTQWLSQVYHFSWLEKSLYSLAILSLCIFLFFLSVEIEGLRPVINPQHHITGANSSALSPLSLSSPLSTMGVKLRTCFCVSITGNRFLNSPAKHLEIGLFMFMIFYDSTQ